MTSPLPGIIPTAPPKLLMDAPAWVLWALEPNPDRPEKPQKVPYYARTQRKRHGKQGTPEDLAELVTFDRAARALERFPGRFRGVGFVPRPEWGVSAIDFDDCLMDGRIAPEVERAIAGTYSEISPSGRGIRAFVRGQVPAIKSLARPGQFGVETFVDWGYVTFTGNLTPACQLFSLEDEVSPPSEDLLALIREREGERQEAGRQASDDQAWDRAIALRGVTQETLADLRSALMDGLPTEYADGYGQWVDVGLALASLKESPFFDEALQLWLDFSQRSAKFNEPHATDKWEGFRPDLISFRSIFGWAQKHGWVNPKAVDRLDHAENNSRSDVGNANILLRETAGDLRYVPERGLWIQWYESQWIPDESGTYSFEAARRVGEHYTRKEAELRKKAADSALSRAEQDDLRKAAEKLHKWALQCWGHRGIVNMLAIASRDARAIVSASQLDTDPWLLGVPNGVVDLRTGQLRMAAREDLVTRRTSVPFDPSAPAPRWRLFIQEITGIPSAPGKYRARPNLAAYLQRALGYAVTGTTQEQKFFIALGAGSNGKNVLLDLVKETLGAYARTLSPEALMASRFDADAERPSPTAAGLAGVRFAVASESKEGSKLDVALVKAHTGNAFMTARRMRENPFEFRVSHKLFLMTNHKPGLDHIDDALRGRLHLIPFDRQWNRPGHPEPNPDLPNGDPGLMDALRAEKVGILAWLVEGALAYVREGLEPPEEVVSMTRSYFSEQDPIAQWIERFEKCDPKQGTSATDLWKDFAQWERDEGDWTGKGPASLKAFGAALAGRHGVSKATVEAGVRYGLRRRGDSG